MATCAHCKTRNVSVAHVKGCANVEKAVRQIGRTQPCCDGTGWTGNPSERCTEHYKPLDGIWFGGSR